MCKACTIDVEKQDLFADKMLGIMNDASLALMVSIGHRVGLFDSMQGQAAATSQEIADRAGLNERYVREWIGAMATGDIVQFGEELGTYVLPPEHAAWLTRAAAPNNLAVPFQFLPMLATVENEIVECFKNGGGVPYSSYPRFHEIMAEESDQTIVSSLVEKILPLGDGVVERLETGAKVLDVGCGSGHAMMRLAQTYPKSTFVGIDLSKDAVHKASELATQLDISNISFEAHDLSEYISETKFDLITAFDSVHDQKDPAGLVNCVANALADDGVFFVQDIAGSSEVKNNMNNPIAPFVYTISCLHCMTVSLAQDGAGLGAAWGKEMAVQMFEDAGFSSVEVKTLEHDFMNNYYICRQ